MCVCVCFFLISSFFAYPFLVLNTNYIGSTWLFVFHAYTKVRRALFLVKKKKVSKIQNYVVRSKYIAASLFSPELQN